MKTVLLAGETFTLAQAAISGYTAGISGRYVNGALHFLAAVRDSGIGVEQLPSERCEADFPRSMDALKAYDAIIVSDISALTLLFTPESREGNVSVNRLALLCDYVAQGGGVMMAGGYTSFQGMDGQARYYGTPLEECLPVICLPHSDGLEAPEGLASNVVARHPIVATLPDAWPPILGINKVQLRAGADTTLIAEVAYRGQNYPLLAAREFGAGRTLAFMTDIGPHWMSRAFLADAAYPELMRNMLRWLCRVI
jgi:uncharacterized membrane protein